MLSERVITRVTLYGLEILIFLAKMYVKRHQSTHSIDYIDRIPFPMMEIVLLMIILDRKDH